MRCNLARYYFLNSNVDAISQSHMINMNKKWILVLVAAYVFLLSGCATFIEGNYIISRGDFRKSIRAVDATIEIKSQAKARSISTVDGRIALGKWAQTGALGTVDGSIEMDEGSICHGKVSDIGGAVLLLPGSRVTGDIKTVTGSVTADGALVEGNIEAISGRLNLRGRTHIQGGIVISNPDPKANDPKQAKPPVIVIGPLVAVEGGIRSTHGGEVWISRANTSVGTISGVRIHWYEGDEPAGLSLGQ